MPLCPAIVRRTLVCASLLVAAGHVLSGAEPTFEERVALLFRPPLAEQIALAPDGRHVAYTDYVDGVLFVRIVDVDHKKPTANIAVGEARDILFSKEKDPARLRFLRWATPNRLVFAPNIHAFPPPPGPAAVSGPRFVAPIFAVDADGRNATELVDARTFEVMLETPIPEPDDTAPPPPVMSRSRAASIVGFPAGDRSRLLIEAQGFTWRWPDPLKPITRVFSTDLMTLDLSSGKTATLQSDSPDSRYVYDWQGNRRLAYGRATNTVDQSFDYRAVDGKGDWRPVERALKALDAKSLRATPANYYGERTLPLGFDFNPNVLYVASNVGRDTFAVQGIDTATGAPIGAALERPRVEFGALEPALAARVLVWDEHRQRLAGVRAFDAGRTTLWIDDELRGLQEAMEDRFPGISVEILDWNVPRTRFLVRMASVTNPGSCFVYQREEKRLIEVTRRTPWLEGVELNDSRSFEFTSRDGARLNGYLTFPRRPRLNTPPLIICFTPGFPAHAHAEFDPEAQMLADMGFIVARVNQRGTLGFGRRHFDTSTAGVDRAPVADALATIEWLAARIKIDRKRVALLGRGFGGYLAVRALQLEPEVFRCAIAIDAPLDPDTWLPEDETRDAARQARRAILDRGPARATELSVLRRPEAITKPVLLIVQPVVDQTIDAANARLSSKAAPVERLDIGADFGLSLPLARARVYRRMQEFFNVNLYDFDVKIGETKEVK